MLSDHADHKGRGNVFEALGSDTRFVLRGLRRSPAFTLVAVLSLAMGVGANTAMFGVVRTLLLTPMPVHAPEELALLGWTRDGDFSISQTGSASYRDPVTGVEHRSNFSYPIYQSLRKGAPAEVELFAFAFLRGVSVAMGDRPAVLAGGALADGDYFSALLPPMELGRPLTPADDRPDAPLVAVLSHSFWMRVFGGDPSTLGATLRVNGNPAEVVGITAGGFKGLSMGGFFPQTEITLPLSSQPIVYPRMAPGVSLFTSEENFWLRVMARVPDDASLPAAEETLQAAMRTQASPLVGGDGHLPELRLLPGSQGAQPIGAETARLLYFLLGVVAVVLIIACANLAGLMLGRGARRQHEMAVRRALGGGRARLVRLTLLEGLALAVGGVGAGLVLAASTRRLFTELLTSSLGSGAFGSTEMEVVLDPVVLGGSAALGVGATLLFGLLPALRLSRLDPVAWLKQRSGAGSASPRLTVGRVLITLQIAVSVPLVVGALLFLRTVANLGAVELGFDPTGVIAFQVDPGYTQLEEREYPRLYQTLLARIETIPGVRSATLMENALMSGIVSNGPLTVDGERHMLYRNAVGPAFVETLGMRLLSGRVPGLQDDTDAPHVGVLNETAVTEIFGGVDPVGRLLMVSGRQIEIIGVVNDTPYRNRRDPVPATLHESALQRNGYGGHNVVVRIEGTVGSVEPALRDAVAQVDPDLPLPEIRSQTALMAESSARERVFSQLLTLFGGFALLLASIGLYGVTSYSVARRTSEIGVRVAVGARPGQILSLVLIRVVVLAAAGLVVGIPASFMVGPLVASLLYGVASSDAASVASAALVMLAVAVAAGLLPALRAARLDVRTALHAE
jgi:predicted permease